MKKGLLVIAMLTAVSMLCGCSIFMAMSGEQEPDLGVVKLGAHRTEVELQLGSPVTVVTMEDGIRLDTYEYQIGNEPSGGRAIGHGVMDLLTAGLWEIIGTPVEAFVGETRRMTIYYDKNDRVAAINRAPIEPIGD